MKSDVQLAGAMRREAGRHVFTLLLVTLPALWAAGGAAAAGSREAPPDEPTTAERLGFGLSLGFGFGVVMRDRQVGQDAADVRFLAIAPHIRLPLAEPGAGDAWYHGRLDGILEGSVLVNFSPHAGHAGEALLALRYLFAPGRRIRPYAEAGLGMGGLAFDLQSQSDGLSFFLLAGLGLRWPLGERAALTTAARWYHISNAQTRLPNVGIDSLLFALGLEFR